MLQVYTPPPTLEKFLLDDRRVRFVVGPLGSGKTTCMILEGLRRASQQRPGPDGIRRTRAAVVRNTLKQLMSTVLPDILAVLGPIARYHVQTSCVRIRVGDVHSDWFLMPLEKPEDQRRLLSMQLTFAWLAEFREIPYTVLPPLRGRVGRYPSKKLAGVDCTWRGIFGESNPFNMDSEWNTALIENPREKWGFYRQPGGRDPRAENVENLPGGYEYYEELMDGADEGWIAVHVDAEIGESLEGKGVWRSQFSRSDHVAPGPTKIVPGAPLLFSFDFGRTPFVMVGQMDPRGQLVVHHEIASEDTGLENFVDAKLVPWLAERQLTHLTRIVTGDPTGAYKGQTDERSCFAVLKERGFPIRPAITNEIWPRLQAVEKRLNMRKGVLISPTCRVTTSALAGGYRFRMRRTGEYDDIPEKRHPVSEAADTLQYLCLLVDGRAFERISGARQLHTMGRVGQTMPVGAWT